VKTEGTVHHADVFGLVRVGLDIQLVFQTRSDRLLFVMAGNYDVVENVPRGVY
jgi:hypothetical protein